MQRGEFRYVTQSKHASPTLLCTDNRDRLRFFVQFGHKNMYVSIKNSHFSLEKTILIEISPIRGVYMVYQGFQNSKVPFFHKSNVNSEQFL
jgi:hypothetical protein